MIKPAHPVTLTPNFFANIKPCRAALLYEQEIFSTKRRRLLPRTLEALLFLKQNRTLWNMALVAIVINREDEEEVSLEPIVDSDLSETDE